uniref:Putative secreted protein n=1 Tax=Anopheles darlingi TaxID=43151 RepID=A0A2M4DCW4_ANODA
MRARRVVAALCNCFCCCRCFLLIRSDVTIRTTRGSQRTRHELYVYTAAAATAALSPATAPRLAVTLSSYERRHVCKLLERLTFNAKVRVLQ